MKQAAMTVIIHLDRRVDTKQQGHVLRCPVGTMDDERYILQRGDVVQSCQIERFITFQSQRFGTVITGELKWQNRHADQIGTVNTFE